MTVQELAKRWGCHVDTVRRKVRAGELEGGLIAGKTLISARSVIKYEAAALCRDKGVEE